VNETIFGPGAWLVLDFGAGEFVEEPPLPLPLPVPVAPAPPIPPSAAPALAAGEALVPGWLPDAVVLFALHAVAIRTSVLAVARRAARIPGWFVMPSTLGIVGHARITLSCRDLSATRQLPAPVGGYRPVWYRRVVRRPGVTRPAWYRRTGRRLRKKYRPPPFRLLGCESPCWPPCHSS
jgi:hypothetical protein